MFFSIIQISNDYCQKSYNGFWGFLVIYNFWSAYFLQGNGDQFFKICMDMHFVSLFFVNERNITTSLLMINLKCAVACYGNLNSSSINKFFLNYGSLNMLFRLFPFLIYFYFNEAFIKKYMNYHLLMQISKIHFKIWYVTEY